MIELVIDECREGVTGFSLGRGRNRRKAHSWRCAECHAGNAGLDTGPAGIHERPIRNSLGER